MAKLIDFYSTGNQDTTQFISGGALQGEGQSVTGNGLTVGAVKFYLQKVTAPTGFATAVIYAHSGTFGTSSVPTGAALATSLGINVAILSTSLTMVTFEFIDANQIVLTNGTNYFVSFEFGGGDASNGVRVGIDNSSPTHPGNRATLNASVWTAGATQDMIFYLIDNSGNKLNNTGIRPHPFSPGLAR